MNQPITEFDPSCMDEYDPNSLPVSEARRRIETSVVPVGERERVALRSALGRVLAEDLLSPLDVPLHTNSAMDGYAIASSALERGGDGPVELVVAGESFAGRPCPSTIATHECCRIMTGAVMPQGTDTVVIQERVERDNGTIRFPPDAARPGDNVREAGEDIPAGGCVLGAGALIGPAELGLLASLGTVEVPVTRRLRVAFFSTGDELRSLGEPLEAGTVYDSNRYTLFGMLARLGVEPIDLGVVRDEPGAVRDAFAEASRCADVVITSGGVSVGEADFVKSTLEDLGVVGFWKIAMKPGRPLAFGRIGKAAFFGLPGNPVSVMVTFYQFVQPALRRMMGTTNAQPPRLKARTLGRLKKRSGRVEFQRGVLGRNEIGEMTVQTTGGQGSGILSSMHQADCFIILPMENAGVAEGDLVEVEPFFGLV